MVAGRTYTQEQRGEEESETCYDLLMGKLLWAHGNAIHYKQWQGGNGPRATPTVMDGRVFAMGATGFLDCLEASTGKPIWSRDVLGELKLENLKMKTQFNSAAARNGYLYGLDDGLLACVEIASGTRK